MLHHTALVSKKQNTKTKKGLVKGYLRRGYVRREQHKYTQRSRIHAEARVGKHK